MTTIVALAGNLARPSRTRSAAGAALALAARRTGAGTGLIDLPDFGPALGAARRIEDLDAPGRALVDRILAADALIAATPIYKGSYTGLFKHLIDLLDPSALRGRSVLLLTTGGGTRHALAVEHQLRPLFAFFEAQTLPTAVHFSDADFENGEPAPGPSMERLARAVDQMQRLLIPAGPQPAAAAPPDPDAADPAPANPAPAAAAVRAAGDAVAVS